MLINDNLTEVYVFAAVEEIENGEQTVGPSVFVEGQPVQVIQALSNVTFRFRT